MLPPDTHIPKENETQEAVPVDDVIELGELTDTLGGPGSFTDFAGGLQGVNP